jgi:cysteinyl-tRNA synthetase
MEGKKILWYTCGPTVYDHSHMGHARAYLTFDIIRRIMEDYFNYQILYHSNITDIDDKIILKARRNKLVGDYTEENKAAKFADVSKYIDGAMKATGDKLLEKFAGLQAAAAGITGSRDKEDNITAQKGAELKIGQFKATQACYELAKLAEKDGIAKAVEQLKTGKDLKASLVAAEENLFKLSDEDCKGAKAEAANRAAIDKENALKTKLQALEKVETIGAVAAVIAICSDPVGEALDKEKGHTVTDHAVFDAHCRKYEQSFLDDMRALGVQDPDVLTVRACIACVHAICALCVHLHVRCREQPGEKQHFPHGRSPVCRVWRSS